MCLEQIERKEKASVAANWIMFCETGHIIHNGPGIDMKIPQECKYCGARVRIIQDGSKISEGFGKALRDDVILCCNLTNNHQWHERIAVWEMSRELQDLFV